MAAPRTARLFFHPTDADAAAEQAKRLERVGVTASLQTLSARTAQAGAMPGFSALAADPTVVLVLASDRLFEDLYAVDFLARLSKLRPLTLLMSQPVPIPLGFGEAYFILAEVSALSARELRGLARPVGRVGGRRPARIGSRFGGMRPMQVHHARLVELTEPRFRKYALALVSVCWFGPLILGAFLYLKFVVDLSDPKRALREIGEFVLHPDRIGIMLVWLLGAGVLLVALLLFLQLATSRDLTWRNGALARRPLNWAFWTCAALSFLLATLVADSPNSGMNADLEGLSFAQGLRAMLSALGPLFLFCFMMLAPFVGGTIIAIRLTKRAIRSAYRQGGGLIRRAAGRI